MRQIYIETEEQSGIYKPGSLCVRVRIFRQDNNYEAGVPAIIGLEVGRTSDNYLPAFNYAEWTFVKGTVTDPQLIRKGIQMFDQFKEKVYKEANDLDAGKASTNE